VQIEIKDEIIERLIRTLKSYGYDLPPLPRLIEDIIEEWLVECAS